MIKPDALFPALDCGGSKAMPRLPCKVLSDGVTTTPELKGMDDSIQGDALGAGGRERPSQQVDMPCLLCRSLHMAIQQGGDSPHIVMYRGWEGEGDVDDDRQSWKETSLLAFGQAGIDGPVVNVLNLWLMLKSMIRIITNYENDFLSIGLMSCVFFLESPLFWDGGK